MIVEEDDWRALRAGGTSGNVPRESYACIREATSFSASVVEVSTRACLRARLVTVEKSL